MRRLLYFVGFAAGAFLMWVYITNLQTRAKQSESLPEKSTPERVSLSARSSPESPKGNAPQIEAYCVKCKVHRVMLNPYATTTKSGRPAVRGTCPICNANMFKMGQM